MNTILKLCLCAFLLSVECATFTNPVYPFDFPDPFVLLEGTTYYAYGTNAQTGPNANEVNIQVLVSENGSLSNWKFMVRNFTKFLRKYFYLIAKFCEKG